MSKDYSYREIMLLKAFVDLRKAFDLLELEHGSVSEDILELRDRAFKFAAYAKLSHMLEKHGTEN